jgi:hypothetical protein
MANLLDDFSTYFITAGIATAGAIFQDTMLDGPDDAIAIYEYQGSSSFPQIASSERSIQIVSRSKSAPTAKSKADALHGSLIVEDGILNLTPARWGVFDLRQPPYRMKVDSQARVYYCFNVGVATYND